MGVTSDHVWPLGAEVERGDMPRDDLELAQRGACPTCGACQFMGSASTGQVLGEALGLALPGSALTPAPLAKLLRYARATGKQAVRLIQSNLTARRILTRDAFENAIIIYAAVGGSTNALLHLPVAAREATTRSGPTAASLDDIEEEPAKQRHWKPVNPLFTLPNVVVTPDAAYYPEEAIHTVRDFAAHEVVRVLTGQPPVSPVNANQLTA